MNELIKKYQKQYLEDLFGLLRIDSVLVEQPEVKEAPFGWGNVEALKYTLALGEKMGFKTLNVDNVAGHIEFGEGEEIIGILCHLDVVPTGEGWTNPPFDPILKDGLIYARGSNDDKGPLMSSLYAMKILKDMGFKPNKRVRLIVGTDEESGSRGVRRYLEVCEKPTMGFSPDAEFPLIYAEKGILSFNIVSKEHSNDIVSIKAGDRYNVVPEKCEVKLNKDLGSIEGAEKVNGAYVFKGKRAHAMEPKNGINALLKAFNYLSDKLDSNLIKFVSKYLNDSRFNDINLACTHDEMGDLTQNTAVCDINSDGGFVGLNLRYPINFNKEEFYKGLREEASKYNLEIVELGDSKPLYVNPKCDLIKSLHESYVEVTGDDKTPLMTIGGGTYARMLTNAVAFGASLPGREEVAHNVDEYMALDDLMVALEVYMKAIQKLGC